MLFRAALMVASALTSGALIGRSAAQREIDKRIATLAQEAAEEVRLQIRHQARDMVQEGLRAFALRTLIKTVLLSLLCVGFLTGIYGVTSLSSTIAVLIVLFIIYDAFNFFPTVKLVVAEIRRHGFRPRTAIGEVVAAHVFKEVLEEVDRRQETKWHETLILRLAGRDKDKLAEEVAVQVSDIARQTSWEDLRPFVVSAAIRMGILTAIYTAFAWAVVYRVSSWG